MVAAPSPRRDQIEQWVGGDQALARLIESLFRVAGDEVPEEIAGLTTRIDANEAAIGVNAAEIVLNALAISENATDIAANTSAIADNAAAILLRLVAANNLSDLDDPTAARANLGLAALAVIDTVATAQIDDAAVTIPKVGATGTPGATTYLRGDGAWSSLPSIVDLGGQPTNNPTFTGELGTDDVAFSGQVLSGSLGSAAAPEIVLGGSTNDGLFSPEAGVVGFATGGAERMRFNSSGHALIGMTANDARANGIRLFPDGFFTATRTSGITGSLNRESSDGAIMLFRRDLSIVGSVSVTTTATAYNTSSDYRLKEDVQPVFGASERVLSLRPCNFAWKADGTRVDGFLAHEAQEVVPNAVTGEKDGPEYQTIDHSKLVPLLTASLQEALTKINDLTARLEALEAS